VRCIETRVGLGLMGWLSLALIAGCGSRQPAPAPAPAAPPTAAAPYVAPAGRLPSPGAVRSWNDVRAQAARRLMAANPGITYDGAVPDPLLAIPVLEIELNGDGSIRKIDVMRVPRQAQDTVQIAIEAVRRAAPFGDVSRLPKPWKFSETFLFNDDRKFKPRTLDP
jgi:hypothetical protein